MRYSTGYQSWSSLQKQAKNTRYAPVVRAIGLDQRRLGYALETTINAGGGEDEEQGSGLGIKKFFLGRVGFAAASAIGTIAAAIGRTIKSAIARAVALAVRTVKRLRLREVFSFLYRFVVRQLLVGSVALLGFPVIGVLALAAAIVGGFYLYLNRDGKNNDSYLKEKLSGIKESEFPKDDAEIGNFQPGPDSYSKKIIPPPVTQTEGPELKDPPGIENAFTKAAANLMRSSQGRSIAGYLDEAAKLSGVDVVTITTMAYLESRFGANVENSTSSARGVTQLLPSTFNQMVSKYGEVLGKEKSDIDNPRHNIIMGAFYLKDILEMYSKNIGGRGTVTDLYLLYFLGPGAGLKFFRASKTSIAKDLFRPKVSEANKGIFFDAGGKPRTVGEMYDLLQGRAEGVRSAFKGQSSMSAYSRREPATTASATSKARQPEANTKPIDLAPVSFILVPKKPEKIVLPNASISVIEEQKSNDSSRSQASANNVNFMRDRNGRVFALGAS